MITLVPITQLVKALMSATGERITETKNLAIAAKNGYVVTNGRPMIDDILAGSYGLKPNLPMTVELPMAPIMK